ncbi:hypothetical protein MKEN_01491200 [Mycena kentingensis (nom. inval.)]|nr:hypothetical protein MKEN_01491200 [Mycena kentingensis (nom. inval.)]
MATVGSAGAPANYGALKLDLAEEENLPFVPSEWLGLGHTYRNVPQHVANALLRVLEPPSALLDKLPSRELDVVAFCSPSLHVPAVSQSLIAVKSDRWFSKDPPSTLDAADIWRTLCREGIPPKNVVTQLRADVGQAWLDGAQSLRDPRQNSKKRLPLHILKIYAELRDIIEARELLRASMASLRLSLKRNTSRYSSAEDILEHFEWGRETVHGSFKLPLYRLAPLLQHVMLHDEITEALVHGLRTRLAADPLLSSKHHLCASRAYNVLVQISTAGSMPPDGHVPKVLREVEDKVRISPGCQVWFPIYCAGALHQTMLRIDFQSGKVEFGDTIRGGKPWAVIENGVRIWLRKRFRERSFDFVGITLKSGKQDDGISCVPASLNIFSHEVFGDELWSPEKRDIHRIELFLVLARKTTTVVSDRARHPVRFMNELLNPMDVTSSENANFSARRPVRCLDHLLNPMEVDSSTQVEQDAIDDAFALVSNNYASAQTLDTNGDVQMADLEADPAPSPLSPAPLTSTMEADPPVTLADEPPTTTTSTSTSTAAAGWAALMSKMTSTPSVLGKRKNGGKSPAVLPPKKKSAGSQEPVAAGAAASSRSDAKAKATLLADGYDPKKQAKFAQKILAEDKDATFDEACPRLVCCSLCGTKKMCDLYRPKELPRSFQEFFMSIARVPVVSRLPGAPGDWTAQAFTQRAIEPLVDGYLKRSGALGGGSTTPAAVTAELFGPDATYLQLDEDDQERVQDTLQHRQTWTNDHDNLRVFARSCSRQVIGHLALDSKPSPCAECLQDGTNIYLRFAQGAMRGEYKDEKVLLGLIDAMITQKDKERRGVGAQNFAYTPEWDEFVHIIHIHSPRAYRFLTRFFPARSERSIRQREAKQTQLPMEICADTFRQQHDYLDAIGYDGPAAVSCDDSKLFPGIRLHHDAAKGVDVVIGAVSGPIVVQDAAAFKRVAEDPQVVRGTKLRLWILQVPLPGIMPSLISAIPITESEDVPSLLALHQQIIDGLLDVNVNVISYSSDGTETERGVQHAFHAKAGTYHTESIPPPLPGLQRLSLRIPIYRKQVMALCQDSKHGIKTLRNNMITGARVLTMGNYVVMYRHLYELAYSENSPLYLRDVERLDRQDDRAAARLIAAPTLRRWVELHPEERGVIVYLFIVGEIGDAYQNRFIEHSERAVMLLRAHYFLEMWRAFIDGCPAYSVARHFLSRECADILKMLIEGLLSLIIIHRDFYPDTPLLPWLHSTEPCEHTFGLARQVIVDFTALDFHRLVPKITVIMREELFASKEKVTADVRATAAGYYHTYNDTTDLNLPNLSRFPPELAPLAARAADEAVSLVGFIGIDAETARGVPRSDAPVPHFAQASDFEPEAEDEMEDICFDVANPHADIGCMGEIAAMVQRSEANTVPYTHADTARLDALSHASIALLLRDQQTINEIDPLSQQMRLDVIADNRRALKELDLPAVVNAAAAPSILPAQIPGIVVDSADELTVEQLLHLRDRHQTSFALKACRAAQNPAHDSANISPQKSAARELRDAFNDFMRSSQDRGVATTLSRTTRTAAPAKSAPGGRGPADVPLPAGNSSNAADKAAAVAKTAQGKRARCWAKHIPLALDPKYNAHVSPTSPITTQSYGIVFHENRLRLARVVALYHTTSGRHAYITQSTSITALSYIVAQLYDCTGGNNFKSITGDTGQFNTVTWAHLPPIRFLCLLSHSPRFNKMSLLYQLESADWKYFTAFSKHADKFTAAIKDFSKKT